jgi:hypothetical protein
MCKIVYVVDSGDVMVIFISDHGDLYFVSHSDTVEMAYMVYVIWDVA